MSPIPPDELQLDVLREVANVGAGHAARALSELTQGQKVGIDIPRALKVDVDGLAQLLGGRAKMLSAVKVDMHGPLTGKLLLTWPEEGALALARQLLNDPHVTLEAVSARSAMAETGNIMVSACLSAVGTLTSFTLLPGVPVVSHTSALDVARDVLTGPLRHQTLGTWVLEAHLFSQQQGMQLLLIPDEASVAALLAQLQG